MSRNKLYRMYWILYRTTFGELWQPAKKRYGNYYSRGKNNRFRKADTKLLTRE